MTSKSASCTHYGVTFVFKIGKCEIYAGAYSEVLLYDDWDLIVSCAGKSIS